ncbi:MAG TPA: amino acid permease [Polyangiaceae bacterium]|nr:amino acid permease [Polyangiaceae bacterium]
MDLTAAASAEDLHTSAPAARLGLWDAVSLIFGIVIGAGIYETAPFVLANTSSPAQALLVWTLGGALSLIGATCYAELATTYPRAGGDYVYLTRAFGPIFGFLFGWAQLAVILTGSIGMMAYVFADYAAALWSHAAGATALFACAAVLLLTLLNLFGLVFGKTTQNVLSWLKLLGLALLIGAGLLSSGSATAAPASAPAASGGSFGLAMVLVLYTYGGWNDAAFVAAEVRDGKRNIARALLLGTLAITIVYLLVNLAFMHALGFQGAQSSKAIAADVLRVSFGSSGGKLMALLVMISALGAVNGLILTGSRVYASLGADHGVFARLSRWHPRWRSPVWALLAQLLVTLLMIFAVGTEPGRAAIDGVLVRAGAAKAEWSGHGGFDTLLRCTAPVFWLFFLLTGISLFVLRRREPDRERPFRVPLYPLFPLIFCGMCGYMLYSAVDYAGALSLFGAALLLLGVPLYFVSQRRPRFRADASPNEESAS